MPRSTARAPIGAGGSTSERADPATCSYPLRIPFVPRLRLPAVEDCGPLFQERHGRFLGVVEPSGTDVPGRLPVEHLAEWQVEGFVLVGLDRLDGEGREADDAVGHLADV